MALEALAMGTPRTQLVLDLHNKWIKEVEELKKTTSLDFADAVSFARGDYEHEFTLHQFTILPGGSAPKIQDHAIRQDQDRVNQDGV